MVSLEGDSRLKKSNIFWIVLVVMILNIVVLVLSKVGVSKTKEEYLADLKVSGWVVGESVVIIAMAGIPFLNLFALILAIPIFFFNVWTKGLPLLLSISNQDEYAKGVTEYNTVHASKVKMDWDTLIKTGKTNNSQD
jgi:hypothetical protein